MSDVDHSCRICRGEATAAQPLIHPCKCRGSIKYIHQDCLLEWLEHSNTKEKKCDICDTPYQFRTIYDPNMPKRMPLWDICDKMLRLAGRWAIKQVSVTLYIICVVQLAVFWKFIGRLFTYAVDGKVPSPDFTIFHVMFYGAYTTRSYKGTLLSSPETTSVDKFLTFLLNTFLPGQAHVLMFVLVLFVIFIEHEWVVREEGYTKLLLRQIGREPRTKLSDLLERIVRNEEPGPDNALRLGMAERALEDLQRAPERAPINNALRQVIEERQMEVSDDENEEPEDLHAERAESDESSGLDQEDLERMPAEDDVTFNDNALIATENPHLNIDFSEEARATAHAQEQDTNPFVNEAPAVNDEPVNAENHNAVPIEDEPEELERRRNLAEDEMAAAEAANNNGNLFELLGFRFNLATPIQLMLFTDFVILLFLFNAYLVPHILGTFIVTIILLALTKLCELFVLALSYITDASRLHHMAFAILSQFDAKLTSIGPVYPIITHQFALPVIEIITNLLRLEPAYHSSIVERIILISLGCFVICLSIHLLMSALIAGQKPTLGNSRRVYKVLFQVTATAKVFAIFAIEIVLFPVYCGWLIDFCAAPLFLVDIVTQTSTGTEYSIFFTTAYPLLLTPYIRFALYWICGTCYMFCIALFVGMIRNHILRPGVLYFIKSPEDPNARLIHDAVVKPFLLQMLRIILSAKVYTAFVVLGCGCVTWGLRFLVNAPHSKGALLPIQVPSSMSLVLVPGCIALLVRSKGILAQYNRLFWSHSFAALCHKFRLSHFILDTPVPQERGSIVYKNTLRWLFAAGEPDFSRPVSYSEALRTFETSPSTNACFVPDGCYVRAPSSDDNSRKFLRELFIPVTKSDQIISDREPVEDPEDTDWWDADVEYEDSYTVVYTPPNLRLRCLGLVCMISVFGALIIVVTLLLAAFIGRPILRAAVISIDALSAAVGSKNLLRNSFQWSLIDVESICLGLQLELQILLFLEYKPDLAALAQTAAEQRRRLARPFENFTVSTSKLLALIAFRALQGAFIYYLHYRYVPEIDKLITGHSILQRDLSRSDFSVSIVGAFLHLFVSDVTVLPFLKTATFTGAAPFREWPTKLNLIRFFETASIVGVHHFFELLSRRKGEVMSEQSQKIWCVVVFVTVIGMNAASRISTAFKNISEQIRNEKYVRGTAVESIEVAGE